MYKTELCVIACIKELHAVYIPLFNLFIPNIIECFQEIKVLQRSISTSHFPMTQKKVLNVKIII